MNLRCVTTALLLALTLATGCIRRASVAQDFGLTRVNSSVRAVLKRQTMGAFNPVNDDPRVQKLEAGLKINPTDAGARLELGRVYEGYRLWDKAFEHYAAGGASEDAVLGLARSARASRRTAEAIPLVATFVTQQPTANSWNELGLLYEDARDLASAERAFQQAMMLDSRSDRAHNNLGYNLLLQNNVEAAEREFREALELNPASAIARNNLGTLLTRRGDLAGALEQFQATADEATAHNNLAVVLLEIGQYERSREELVKALAIRRYFAPALANFKLVQERMRERAELQKVGRLPLSAVRVNTLRIDNEKILDAFLERN